MAEKKTRRPVTSEHPCIAAAVAVLRETGRPMLVSEIFEVAHDKGLLPESSHNTIRGRFSQHMQGIKDPVIEPATARRWQLGHGTGMQPKGRKKKYGAFPVRNVKLRRATLIRKGAPFTLVEYVSALPGQTLSVRAALLTELDEPSLAWVLAGCGGLVRFNPDLSERLRVAKNVTGRARVIHAAERRRAAGAA